MTQNLSLFKDQVVLITGASSGIGRSTAQRFAALGAKVMVSDINIDLGQQTADMIQKDGGEASFFKCDMTKPQEIEDLVQETVKTYGKLDIACNNAGIEGQSGSVVDCTIENWGKVINTNLRGVWLSMKYEIPQMLKQGGGAIVNTSSIAGLVGFTGLPAYVASKHGVVGLTKTAALEFAEKNIRVNAVCPGPIQTPMLQRIMDTTPGFNEQIVAGVPEKRIGTPEEVAEAIVFLCQPSVAYVTGQCLAVDGGWVAQ